MKPAEDPRFRSTRRSLRRIAEALEKIAGEKEPRPSLADRGGKG